MADVSDRTPPRGLIEAATDAFGRLDILVNNVAVRKETEFREARLP